MHHRRNPPRKDKAASRKIRAHREPIRESEAAPEVMSFAVPEEWGPSFTTKYMAGLSTPMYRVARRLALEASEARDEQLISITIATVIMAVTALEAFVNEELAFTATHGNRQALEAIRDNKNLSLREKWAEFLEAVCGNSFRKGREPFQSFWLLCELRNGLVHTASQFRASGDFPKASMAKLPFIKKPSPGTNVAWDHLVLNAECARWACNRAVEIIGEHWRIRKMPARMIWEPIP